MRARLWAQAADVRAWGHTAAVRGMVPVVLLLHVLVHSRPAPSRACHVPMRHIRPSPLPATCLMHSLLHLPRGRPT